MCTLPQGAQKDPSIMSKLLTATEHAQVAIKSLVKSYHTL